MLEKLLPCLALLLFAEHNCLAHDLPGIVAERNSLDAETRAKFDEIHEIRRVLAQRSATEGQDRGLEAVIQRSLRWPSSTITVCFNDGRARTRDQVAVAASDWTNGTGFKFDFGPPDNRRSCDPNNPSDIRVSFAGSGNWSYVGIQAKLISSNKPTLNLQGLDRGETFSQREKGTILHEFGHAIGFEHEHQSTRSGCEEEFDWPYLYANMGWSKAEVDRNMRRIGGASRITGLLTTPFDAQSIMLYSLEPAAFKNPDTATCFIRNPNNRASVVDRTAIQFVYPIGPPSSSNLPLPAGAPSHEASAIAPTVEESVRRLEDITSGK